MKSCICNLIEVIEEAPITDIVTYFKQTFEPPTSLINVDLIKEKVIEDVYHVVKLLECGVLPDLELILEEISFIEIYDEL